MERKDTYSTYYSHTRALRKPHIKNGCHGFLRNLIRKYAMCLSGPQESDKKITMIQPPPPTAETPSYSVKYIHI